MVSTSNIFFLSIMSSDPGFVKVALSNADNTMELDSSAIGLCSTQTSMERRVRFCKTCDAFVRGYVHHCPAFGNCIAAGLIIIDLVINNLGIQQCFLVVVCTILLGRAWLCLLCKPFLAGTYDLHLVRSCIVFFSYLLIWGICRIVKSSL
ncbi:hypothetical protein Droror1_Dr00015484 [Drosera rotundifolia]